jgi:iron(III) transport system permease protein
MSTASSPRHAAAYWPTGLLLLSALALCVFMLAPLGTLLIGSVLDDQGQWSLSRFVDFANTPVWHGHRTPWGPRW